MAVEKSNVFAIQMFEVRKTIIASEIFEQGRQSFLENLELYDLKYFEVCIWRAS
jgi:hypothetical protein